MAKILISPSKYVQGAGEMKNSLLATYNSRKVFYFYYHYCHTNSNYLIISKMRVVISGILLPRYYHTITTLLPL